ncbi:hypothetical protein B1M_00545 [Burkholderia sp. TJI49]|nr:hypothetical protein B1M_00545 [Burkholderia sp. TJI49]
MFIAEGHSDWRERGEPAPSPADERAAWDDTRHSLAVAMCGFAIRSGSRDLDAAIRVLDAITEEGSPLSWLRYARAVSANDTGAKYEALEREHLGDTDKRTGIYSRSPAMATEAVAFKITEKAAEEWAVRHFLDHVLKNATTQRAAIEDARTLHLLDAAPQPASAKAVALPQPVLDALRFYANGHHYAIDNDHQQFDTVSGEPQNWLFSERDDDTTMIEDGSIAKAALCGGLLGFEEPEKPLEGEVFGVVRAALATRDAGMTDEQRDVLGGNFGALEQAEDLCRATGNDSSADGLSALSYALRALLQGANHE